MNRHISARSLETLRALNRKQVSVALLREQENKCYWCGRPIYLRRSAHKIDRPDNATIDHLKPTGLGGADTIDNIVMACLQCNNERGCTEGPPPRLNGAAPCGEKQPLPVLAEVLYSIPEELRKAPKKATKARKAPPSKSLHALKVQAEKAAKAEKEGARQERHRERMEAARSAVLRDDSPDELIRVLWVTAKRMAQAMGHDKVNPEWQAAIDAGEAHLNMKGII